MEIIKKIKGYNRNLIRLLSTNRNNGYNVNRIINEIEKEKFRTLLFGTTTK